MREKQKVAFEGAKLLADYCKHICTLSTGSVILIATFLAKLFEKPQWKFLVALSLGAYMASVVGSVLSYTIEMTKMTMMASDDSGEETDDGYPVWLENINATGAFTMWAGFLIGTISLGVFAIKNLLA